MNVLLVGGAGYIGSHMAKTLVRVGHSVCTFDNLSTGFRDAVRYGAFFLGQMASRDDLDSAFAKLGPFDAVMHFAGSIEVGESKSDPAKYYRNNVANTLTLLDAALAHKVRYFIFSSSAAIFGNPQYTPIDEAHAKSPINPYGHCKLMIETVLRDYAGAYGLNSVALRYFNASGADPEGEMGERHAPESHLIPLILQAALGQREAITVFGRDYATRDGTCIRDYVHVSDLCQAHLLALHACQSSGGAEFRAYNLGNGSGFTVQEVLAACKEVVAGDGRAINVLEGPRREGDPPVLIADASKARAELAWAPAYPDLRTIIAHAWSWEKRKLAA
jgi:UDP-glucose 4-epimerase